MVYEVKSDSEFKEKINSAEIVVVDFYATWCGPCKFISPKVEEFSKKYTKATFIKVDVDTLPNISAEYEIQAMPTFQIFKNGKKVDEVIGADANKLEKAIQKAVA
ncbi:hypothetical protein MIR68_005093 [Amoeboaphelidium protococcarum]|nr:hypothetical protein MIR68_005093 [Amoeboaphelidium protococcarum]